MEETIITGRPPVKSESLEGIKAQTDKLSFTNGKLDVNATVTGASGGTSAVDKSTFTAGTTSETPIGGVYQASPDTITDGQTAAVGIDANRALKVHVTASDVASGGTSATDGGGFTASSTSGTPMMGAYHSTIDTVADGKVGIVGMTNKRAQFVNLQTSGGAETGVAATPLQVSLANTAANSTAVKVDGSAVTQPVSDGGGSLTVDNAGIFAVQATVAASATNIAKAEDVASADADVGVPAMAIRKATPANTSGTDGDYEMLQMSAGRLWVDASGKTLTVDGSGVTQPVSGTVSITANSSVNVNQLAGTTTDTNSGNKSAGTLRVVIATDQPQLTNKLLVTPDANSAVNVSQVGGNAISTGNGTAGTGTARVTVASDNSDIPVKLQPQTSGGLTTYHLASAGSTNATNIKASAGQLYGWYVYNSNASARKVAFHNSASTPTAGASIFFSIVIPPTSAANVFSDIGIPFSSGIGITTVTGLADSDSTAVAANDLIINLFYK